jgi:hypothetical protein
MRSPEVLALGDRPLTEADRGKSPAKQQKLALQNSEKD